MKKVIVEIASNEHYVPAYGERVSWEVVYRTEGRNFSNGILYAKIGLKKKSPNFDALNEPRYHLKK